MRKLIDNGGDDVVATVFMNSVDMVSICSFPLEHGTSAGDIVALAPDAIPDVIKEMEAVYASWQANHQEAV